MVFDEATLDAKMIKLDAAGRGLAELRGTLQKLYPDVIAQTKAEFGLTDEAINAWVTAKLANYAATISGLKLMAEEFLAELQQGGN